jgi:hypothetical protein
VRGAVQFDQDLDPDFEILAEADRLGLRLHGHSLTMAQLRAQQPLGEQVAIEISTPEYTQAYFACDMRDLLSRVDFRTSIPTDFYVAESAYLRSRDDPSDRIAAYFQIVELADILVGIGDHVEKGYQGKRVVFLTGEAKVEVVLDYADSDLVKLEGLDDLRVEALEPPHMREKREIMRAALIESVGRVSTEDRFRTLLRSFPDFLARFRDNYALYLSEFSFETERERIEALKREYLLKLNAAVGEIHAKLIAIPAATILVAGQMKPPDSMPSRLSNAVLLFGAIIFGVLMWILTANQRHSLNAIKAEYAGRRVRLENHLPVLFSQLKDQFDELEERYKHQLLLIWIINVLIVFGALVSIAVFVGYARL